LLDSLRQPDKSSAQQHPDIAARAARNFLKAPGFHSESPASTPQPRKSATRVATKQKGLLWAVHRMRRRRLLRRLYTFGLIVALGAGVGWLITRQPGGGAFSLPTATHSAPDTLAATTPNHDLSRSVNGYKQGAGPFDVREVPDVLLSDAKRNRDVRLRVLYPAAAGRYPVILFSGDDSECCAALLRNWSTHGYIVVQIAAETGHHDDGTSIQRVQLQRGKREVSTSSPIWENYPLDISFVIDSLAEIQNRIPPLRRKPDLAHIGVAGRGIGAFAAEAIAGTAVDLPGHSHASLADPRVRAVLCLSPQGPGRFGLRAESFEQLVLPYLGITGEMGSAPRDKDSGYRAPFERSQAGDKYELSIEETAVERAHLENAASLDNATQPQDLTESYTDSAALAFWDAYLKHDLFARRYLQSDGLQKASAGRVKLERR
jgi:predicted dienelactone hydrolase